MMTERASMSCKKATTVLRHVERASTYPDINLRRRRVETPRMGA
jgi:hypothetical protein